MSQTVGPRIVAGPGAQAVHHPADGVTGQPAHAFGRPVQSDEQRSGLGAALGEPGPKYLDRFRGAASSARTRSVPCRGCAPSACPRRGPSRRRRGAVHSPRRRRRSLIRCTRGAVSLSFRVDGQGLGRSNDLFPTIAARPAGIAVGGAPSALQPRATSSPWPSSAPP